MDPQIPPQQSFLHPGIQNRMEQNRRGQYQVRRGYEYLHSGVVVLRGRLAPRCQLINDRKLSDTVIPIVVSNMILAIVKMVECRNLLTLVLLLHTPVLTVELTGPLI